jgi:hypothetical protein
MLQRAILQGHDSILMELTAYDYWGPTSSETYYSFLQSPLFIPIFTSPIPSPIALQYLAKVRLQGIVSGEVLPATQGDPSSHSSLSRTRVVGCFHDRVLLLSISKDKPMNML